MDDKGKYPPSQPVRRLEHGIREYRPIQKLLLLDVLRDRESRPLLLWAGGALLLGVAVYHWLEGWSVIDALYFCVITLATIGYGDLTPTTPLAKLFTIFYVINGIGILLGLFDRIRAIRSRQLLRNESEIDIGEDSSSDAE
jgi:hypothetical protein